MNKFIIFFIIQLSILEPLYGQIIWNQNWAFGCDFKGNDLSNAQVPGEQCGPLCERTPGCTHFTWTKYNKGTCWMKKGSVSKSNAFQSNDNSMVCGVNGRTNPNPNPNPGPNPGPTPSGDSVPFSFINKCSYDIWVGAFGKRRSNPSWRLSPGGWKLSPGQTVVQNYPKDLFDARFWGRTGCNQVNNNLYCETGGCDNLLDCKAWGRPPVTLAEFGLAGFANADFYDISLVDGFNIPMSIIETNPQKVPNNKYACGSPKCTKNLNQLCPAELQQKNSRGQVIACYSACEKFKQDQYCCVNAFNENVCKPSSYAAFFKNNCPDAYSYAYDDKTSMFACKNTGYQIIFC